MVRIELCWLLLTYLLVLIMNTLENGFKVQKNSRNSITHMEKKKETKRIVDSLTNTTGYDTIRNVISESTCTKCRDELLQRARRLNFDEWYVRRFFFRFSPRSTLTPFLRPHTHTKIYIQAGCSIKTSQGLS